MFRNTFLLFITAIILFFLLLSSCNETSILENKTINTDEVSLLKGTKKEVKIIGYETIVENGKKKKVPIYDGDPNAGNDPKALPCDIHSVYVSEFDHFSNKGDKKIGMWDVRHIRTPFEYKHTWGFSMFFVRNDGYSTTAINSGFTLSNLLVGLDANNSFSLAPFQKNYKYYFLDEPKESHDLSTSQVIGIANNVAIKNSNAKLLISSYQTRTSTKNFYQYILFHTSNTEIMCDYYDGDQGNDWTTFKNYYGNKNKSNWISLITDGEDNDFNGLFSKANILGIKDIWIYSDRIGLSNYDVGNLINLYLVQLCNSAFSYGWLRKFIHVYKYLYMCPDNFEDPCWCKKNNTGWVLFQIQDLGIQEVYN